MLCPFFERRPAEQWQAGIWQSLRSSFAGSGRRLIALRDSSGAQSNLSTDSGRPPNRCARRRPAGEFGLCARRPTDAPLKPARAIPLKARKTASSSPTPVMTSLAPSLSRLFKQGDS
uniref:Uncharacterized protein n=1 Tax=Plectus sambesii TaxID=2011161 RepID=A0A914X8N4_9BILA